MKGLAGVAGFVPILMVATGAAASPAYLSGNDVYDLPYFGTSIHVGDLNGDARPDMVALIGTVLGTSAVVVKLNLGDGTFGADDTTHVPDSWNVMVAELDGDSKPDVLVQGSSGFSVLHGNGDGTLGARYDFQVWSNDRRTNIAIADVDLDGRSDVLSRCTRRNLDQPGARRGGVAHVHVAPGKRVTGIVTARWNADLFPDVGVWLHEPSDDSLAVLLNDGAGQMGMLQIVGRALGGDLFAGDVDRDGDDDLVTTTAVLRGHGDGTFDAPVLLDSTSSGEDALECRAIGDLEPDGPFVEMLLVGQDGRFHVRPHLGVSPFEPVPPLSGATFAAYLHDIADLNADGVGDVVSLHGASAAIVNLGRGLGRFGSPHAWPTPSTGISKFAMLNADGDGRPDFVILSNAWSAAELPRHAGCGGRSFLDPVILTVPPDGAVEVVTGDVDGDSNDDVVAALLSGGVAVFLGNGDGTFDPPTVQLAVAFGGLWPGT